MYRFDLVVAWPLKLILTPFSSDVMLRKEVWIASFYRMGFAGNGLGKTPLRIPFLTKLLQTARLHEIIFLDHIIPCPFMAWPRISILSTRERKRGPLIVGLAVLILSLSHSWVFYMAMVSWLSGHGKDASQVVIYEKFTPFIKSSSPCVWKVLSRWYPESHIVRNKTSFCQIWVTMSGWTGVRFVSEARCLLPFFVPSVVLQCYY